LVSEPTKMPVSEWIEFEKARRRERIRNRDA
jgi:hypothetical protein